MKSLVLKSQTARALVLIGAVLTPGLSAAQSDPAGQNYSALRAAVETFRGDSKQRALRHHYKKHIEAMRGYAAAHPDSDRADDALYVAAQLHDELYRASYVSSDLDAAVLAYVELADRFPASNLTDDALFRVARIRLEHLGDRDGARDALARVVEMPNADFRSKARELLARLPDATEAETPAPSRALATLVAKATPAEGAAKAPAEVAGERHAPGLVLQSEATRARRLRKSKVAGRGQKRALVMTLSGDVNAKRGEAEKTSDKPRRVFYDLYPLTAPHALTRLDAKTDDASGIRIAQYNDDTVRVVVEVTGAFTPAMVWDAKKKQLRLPLVDVEPVAAPALVAVKPAGEVSPSTSAPPKTAPKPTAAVPAPAVASAKAPVTAQTVKARLGTDGAPGGVSISQQMGLAVKRIVVDAGHGGKDVGAVGPSGLREKDVTLAIAKLVKKKLNKRLPGVEVILTRSDDHFVELKDRTDIANGKKADLFISIHANANPSRRVHGVETYYLNITHDRYAMRLAARENRETGGDHKISDLEFILADLAMKSNVDDSIRLGRHVQSSLVGNLRKDYKNVEDLGLKHALFYVLLGSHMPAILVETSFVSNRMEEKRLKSTKYRDDVAEGVVRGVQRFVEERQAFAQR